MTHRNAPRFFLFAFALSLAACGSVDAGPDRAGPDGGGADHRGGDGGADGAVTVVSVSPADGDGGVSPDADITVVFSRAMDEASVEAAWSSELLPAGAVAFSWNASGDTLTVMPDDPLPVAEGSGDDPGSVEAAAVSFAIGDSARDAAGNPLAEPLEVEFRTVRRMTVATGYDISLSDCRTKTSSVAWSDSVLYAGDTYSKASVRMVMSFALPQLPAGAALENALVSASQSTATTGMYGFFGNLAAVHVRFASVADAYDALTLHSLGTFSESGLVGPRSVTATTAVADDLADGVSHAQFRLQFKPATDSDEESDLAQFSRSSLKLTLTYLVE